MLSERNLAKKSANVTEITGNRSQRLLCPSTSGDDIVSSVVGPRTAIPVSAINCE